MAGVKFGGGVRVAAGVKSLPQARYGSVPSPRSPSEAAFGPSFTSPTASTANTLAPNDAFGIATVVGVVCMAALVWIYTTLPG